MSGIEKRLNSHGTLQFDMDGCVARRSVDQPHARLMKAFATESGVIVVLHVPSHTYWVQLGNKRETAPAEFQLWRLEDDEAAQRMAEWLEYEQPPDKLPNRPAFQAHAEFLGEIETRGAEPLVAPPIRNGKPCHQHQYH